MKSSLMTLVVFSFVNFALGATSTKITGFRVATMDKGANNPFGLIAGDVLLQADNKKMTSLEAAQKFYANPGSYEKIKILREGKEVILTKVIEAEY